MNTDPRLYDMSFWIADDGSGNAPDAYFESVKAKVSEFSGTISHDRRLEKRMLSYPIKKQTNAWWAEMQFTMAPDKLLSFKDSLKYEDKILRKVITSVIVSKKIRKPRLGPQARQDGSQRIERSPKAKESDVDLDPKLKQILETEKAN